MTRSIDVLIDASVYRDQVDRAQIDGDEIKIRRSMYLSTLLSMYLDLITSVYVS